LLKTEKQKGSR